MKKYLILFIIGMLLACSDSNESYVENRLNTAQKFIECLEKNTPEKILKYTYSGTDHKIDEKSSREFYITSANKEIKKYGVPSKEKWITEFDSNDNLTRLKVIVPIFNGYDSITKITKIDIILKFPPPNISNKIYNYEIEREYHKDHRVLIDNPFKVE